MTSPDLDRRLREADPYERVDLAGADALLLEEILRQSPVDPAVRSRARRIRRSRVTLKSRLAISVATAAVVTGVIAVPMLMAGQDAGLPSQADGTPAQASTPEVLTPVRYAAAAVKVAKANPRVLVTAPDWKVRTMEGFSATEGQMSFQQGADRYREVPHYGQKMAPENRRALEKAVAEGKQVAKEAFAGPDEIVGYDRVNDAPSLKVAWYPGTQHADWVASRSGKGDPSRWVELWGKRVLLVSYSAADHAVVLPVQGKVFLELRGRGVGGEAAFLRFLAEQVEQVDVPTWLAALPPEVVTVGGAKQAVERILADIPVPPGFDRDAELDKWSGRSQALDSYQFGAAVTGAVACGWIDEWKRARAAGDESAVQHAADQLSTSRDWKALQEMDVEGDYPEVVWEYADRMAAGQKPEGAHGGLGCR